MGKQSNERRKIRTEGQRKNWKNNKEIRKANNVFKDTASVTTKYDPFIRSEFKIKHKEKDNKR